MSSPRRDRDEPARSLVEAWQSDVASAGEVRRAYHRFVARRRSLSPRPIGRWLLIGVALGVSSGYAATRTIELWLAPAETKIPRPSAAAVPAPAPAPQTTRAPAPPPEREPSDVASPAYEPPVVNPVPELPSTWSHREKSWQRAAQGLRERDFATAEAALEELSRRGSTGERESARLVHAQLLIAQGRAQEATVALRDLASSAISTSVKQQAAALLARANQSLPSQRSFEPLEGTKLP